MAYGRLMAPGNDDPPDDAKGNSAKRSMHIVQTADLPAVVRITERDATVVAVPDSLSVNDILALASVVLTGEEFAELERQLVPVGRSR